MILASISLPMPRCDRYGKVVTAPSAPLRVALGGIGAIGFKVATTLDEGIPGLNLVAVSARDRDRAAERTDGFKSPPEVLPLDKLAEHADIVVECAPAAVFDQVAAPAIEAGRIFLPMSSAALINRPELIERAKETGARIVVPTGALIGFDAVRAAAEGTIRSVRMKSVKPIEGMITAPYLVERGIDVRTFTSPQKVFDGTAREAATGFPANTNITAALSLAGIGPDETKLEIWADPGTDRNIHTVELEGDETRFSVTIEGIPSPGNPASGLLVPLSLVATLRSLTSPLRIGT